MTIRRLHAADIVALTGVLTRAYASQQNFTRRLEAYLQMSAVATFVAELDGVPVGMVVGNDYGRTAYVSQMAVDPVVQRRGIGTALMDALIAWTNDRFAAIELDATPVGAPLYTRYGFAQCGETIVYGAVAGAGDARAARPYACADRLAVFDADAQAFGSDRRDVLRLLLDCADNRVVVVQCAGGLAGYAVAQSRLELLGPVIAATPSAAADLIDAARLRLSGNHRMSVPAENEAAQTIAAERGYRRLRTLAHMVRGISPPARRPMLFARINLGQG